MARQLFIICLAVSACAARSGPRARVGDVPVELYLAEDGTPAVEPSKPIPAGKMVCVMERITGTMIPERVCHYEEVLDAKRQETQLMLLHLPHTHPCAEGKQCP